jgi:hypothetical protein
VGFVLHFSGRASGLQQSIASNLTGVVISSLTLLTIAVLGSHPIVAAVCVGIGSAAMVQASKLPLASAIPTFVWGFASTVGTAVAMGKPITAVSLANPAIVVGVAMVLGGVFGYISEICGDALCGEGKSVESKSTAGGATS